MFHATGAVSEGFKLAFDPPKTTLKSASAIHFSVESDRHLHAFGTLCQVFFYLFTMITPTPEMGIMVNLIGHVALDILLHIVAIQCDKLLIIYWAVEVQMISDVGQVPAGDQQVQAW